MLVTGEGSCARSPTVRWSPHADLSGLGVDGFNEIVVDGRGNIYVNGGCDFDPGEGNAPGIIALVTPDGSVRRVADGIAFPNGMAVTPDNSTLIIAESFAARLTAFDIADDGGLSNRRVVGRRRRPRRDLHGRRRRDLDGCRSVGGNVVGRVREGGEVLERVQLDMPCFACMLGGEDRPDAVHADRRLADERGLRGQHRSADRRARAPAGY